MPIQNTLLQDVFYALDGYTRSWRSWYPGFLLSRYFQTNSEAIHSLKKQLQHIHIFSFQTAQEVARRYIPVIELAIEKHMNQHVLKNPGMADHYASKIHLGKTMECLLSAYCTLNTSDTERRAFIATLTHMPAFKGLKQSHPGIASKVLYRLYGSLGLSFDEYLRKVKYHVNHKHYDPTDSKARAILSIYRY